MNKIKLATIILSVHLFQWIAPAAATQGGNNEEGNSNGMSIRSSSSHQALGSHDNNTIVDEDSLSQSSSTLSNRDNNTVESQNSSALLSCSCCLSWLSSLTETMSSASRSFFDVRGSAPYVVIVPLIPTIPLIIVPIQR